MTFHKTRLLLLSLVAAATLTASETAQDTLRWKFKKGQKLNYVMTQNMDMSTKVMGRAIDMKLTNIMDMDWVVQTVKTDGTAEITQVISRVRFSMSGGPLGKSSMIQTKKTAAGEAR